MTDAQSRAASGIGETATNEIVDIHCHAASLDFLPFAFLEGAVMNMWAAVSGSAVGASPKRIMSFYLAKLNDPLCDELVAEMAEAGISQSVLLLPDFTYAIKGCPLTIAEMIERHRAIVDRHPGKFLVFPGVDPRWGRDGVALFERAVDVHGFQGLKVYPPCGYSPSDRRLYPYYELCAARSLPVLVHIGPSSPVLSFETSTPMQIDRAARDFPGVDFILAHGSVHYVDECVMLCCYRPNVYLDVSGYETVDIERLGKVLRRGMAHKVLFGTDWPFFRLQGTQRDFVQRLQTQAFADDMDDRAKAAFFSGNARRLLTRRAAAANANAAGRGAGRAG